jgi:hypothetical protein
LRKPIAIQKPSAIHFCTRNAGFSVASGLLQKVPFRNAHPVISEVFRFEDLGFELVAEDFYKVFFRHIEIGEFDVEALLFRPMPGLAMSMNSCHGV